MAKMSPTVVKEKANSLRSLLSTASFTEQLKMALPNHLTVDRLLRVVVTSVQKTPKLLECSQESILKSVMEAAQLGLCPDGILGEAYLVPYKNTCQLIPGYRGYLTLARNSGEVETIHAQVVYEKDDFKMGWSLHGDILEHIPSTDAPSKRGDIVCAYALARYKNGGFNFEVVYKEEIDSIRDKSQGYVAAKKYGFDSPWISDYPAMAKKTAIRRLSKYLPLSVQKVAALEEARDRGEPLKIEDGDLTIDIQEIPEKPKEEAGNPAPLDELVKEISQ